MKYILLGIILVQLSNQAQACPIYNYNKLRCSQIVDGVEVSFVIDKQEVFKNQYSEEYGNTYTVSTDIHGHINNLIVPSTKWSDEVFTKYYCDKNQIVTEQTVGKLNTKKMVTKINNGINILGDTIVTVRSCSDVGCTTRYEVSHTDMSCIAQ